MRYGYARVSTNDQDFTLQIGALEKADCSVIRKEKVSESTYSGISGLGPMNLISPLITFINCGNSSSFVFLKKRPHLVA